MDPLPRGEKHFRIQKEPMAKAMVNIKRQHRGTAIPRERHLEKAPTKIKPKSIHKAIIKGTQTAVRHWKQQELSESLFGWKKNTTKQERVYVLGASQGDLDCSYSNI